jgi:guanine deaminase
VKQGLLYRASILHFSEATTEPEKNATFFKDGALVVNDGKIVAIGEFQTIKPVYNSWREIDYSGRLILPGLIDSHLHFPQTEMIAKYGDQLLSWLENYTFPTEQKFSSFAYCKEMAKHFIAQLINNGTTSAFAFSTVHAHSVNALFSEASYYNMAFITGKVCMDRNCPDFLKDTPEVAQTQSIDLINKWHGNGRNLYALTPRFAPTSSEEQLARLGELASDHPSVFVQTHLSENQDEIAWVKELFGHHNTYLDVYDQYNMVHSRSLFGHCLHLQESEWARLADAGATAVFCPTSNLFLGSGLFNIEKAQRHSVSIALATDVGAGTTFNMLRTYGEAYKIGQLQQRPLNALSGLYMMTQGPATAYGLSEQIGNLNPTTVADFIVLNPYFNELAQRRVPAQNEVEDTLFALSFLGDERMIEATYIAGVNCKKLAQERIYAMA